jgi:RHS repeat-associated protein
MQETHYYPFGMIFSRPSDTGNKYLYNGKEMQLENDLDWLDFGFRFYDLQLGRFTGIDPIAEQYYYVTPYNYAENEPIANIDLWGLQKVSSNKIQPWKQAKRMFKNDLGSS